MDVDFILEISGKRADLSLWGLVYETILFRDRKLIRSLMKKYIKKQNSGFCVQMLKQIKQWVSEKCVIFYLSFVNCIHENLLFELG